jgi:hypothetical protein
VDINFKAIAQNVYVLGYNSKEYKEEKILKLAL